MKKEPIKTVKLYKRDAGLSDTDDRKTCLWTVPWGLSLIAALVLGYWVGLKGPRNVELVQSKTVPDEVFTIYSSSLTVSAEKDLYKEKCRRAYLALKEGKSGKAFRILDE